MAPNDQDEFGSSTKELAEYIESTSYSDIPAEVLEREKWHILDTVGCILYGTGTPWVEKARNGIEAMDESGDVSVLGTTQKLSPARATLINGTASHSMDFDDYCKDAGVHAGSAVVPSGLAHVESSDKAVSGKEFLTAVTLGVETSIRTGIGIGINSLLRGWHIAGWTGSFAAAVTTGKLRSLDTDQLGHAIGIAGTQGAGLMGAAYGADVKRFHMGKAAESGFLAANFAEQGFTGDGHIFEERWGSITTTMSDEYDIGAITKDLGDEYELLSNLSFKPFPSVGQVHPSVNALEAIVSEHDIDVDEIEKVDITLTEAGKEKAGWEFQPHGVMSAQGSIQYAITAYLLNGNLTIEDYTDDAINRPEIMERKSDVNIIGDDSLVEDASSYNARYRTVVEVETKNGQHYNRTIEIPKGFPSNPMTESEREEKFYRQASYAVSDSDAQAILNFILNIESQDDVSDVFEYM